MALKLAEFWVYHPDRTHTQWLGTVSTHELVVDDDLAIRLDMSKSMLQFGCKILTTSGFGHGE